MSSINDILKAFNPVLKDVANRVKSKQVTSLDHRIVNLHKSISASENGFGSSTIGDFEVVNTHLSRDLNLSHLRTSLECSSEITGLIVTYLKLQQNFDLINPTLPLMERIQSVSERVLKHVTLYDVQVTGFVGQIEDSPVWYALATDEQFLNRQVLDLKKFRVYTKVASAKIRDIEERNAALINNFREIPNLTLGKLRLLSPEALNGIASTLPPSAGRLFSDNQIRSINFDLFSSELLDEMVGGDDSDEEISRRLSLLSSEQIEVFLKKSSGRHFAKFPDSFYQMLPLSRLSEEQVKALFNDDYGLQKEKSARHLQLVTPEEVSKGFHLLPAKLATLLSDAQLALLDYRNMDASQISNLFLSHLFQNSGEAKRRIQLIPDRFVNDVARISGFVVASLSPSQFRVLNTALLDQETVRKLFPAFTIETLHPGHTYSFESFGRIGMRHKFKKEGSMSSYSEKELADKFNKNKTQCTTMVSNFSPEQLHTMKPLMFPECQELIAQGAQ